LERKIIFKNNFRLIKCGSGATGEVYKAIMIKNMAKCAIKIIKVTAETNISMFEIEIKMMEEIDHPNSCKYYGCYGTENEIWIVMEYISGFKIK
jgi:serine/threonine protein kinase